MTQTVIDYAKEMKRLSVSPEDVKQTVELLEALPQVKVDFENPTVELEKKIHLIEMISIFSQRSWKPIMRNYAR